MGSRRRVGESLRTLREAVGMTQDELATAVGVGSEHLHAIERGDAVPSSAFLAAAAAALAEHLRAAPEAGGSP